MRTPDARTLLLALGVAIGLTCLSGILLSFVYDGFPGERVRGSMLAIEASSAWSFARGVHAAAASLSVLASALVAARLFLDGANGRAVGYGALTLGLLLAAFQTGTILPLDQRAWEAWTHVRDGAALLGLTLTEPLPAIAATHGAVLGPIAAAPAAWSAYRAGWRWPVALASLAAIVLLAIVAPPALGPEPVEGLAVSRPAWPFLWLSPLQDAFGTWALWLLPAALAALALLAWLAASWTPRARRAALGALLLALGVLTLLGL